MKTTIENKEELLVAANESIRYGNMYDIFDFEISDRDVSIYEKFINDLSTDITNGRDISPIMEDLNRLNSKICRTVCLLAATRELMVPEKLNIVEKAILKSDLGLTPSSDGKIIRIAIPALTEDRRKELVKVVHKICEDYKVSVRNIRRESNDLIKSLKKDGDISEDDAFKGQDQIQKITDDSIKQVDEIYTIKEKEILEF